MNKENSNITEGKIINAGSDTNSSKVKSNNADNDTQVIEENSGTVYSVGDVLEVGAKHHGISANVSDIQNNSNKTSGYNSNTSFKRT